MANSKAPLGMTQGRSDHDPLDFIKASLVVASIVKTRCVGALVVRNLLRHF